MSAVPVSPALAPPPGHPRFPLLDAVRGLAAIAIVVTHAAGVSQFNANHALGAYTARLNVGLTLFFLLTGFLLYRPFVAARIARRPPVGVPDYVRRRVVRIVPAYWVALTVLALWPGLPAFWDGPWWRSYSFTQVYWAESATQGIFPAWSLCVEVSFYLALPLLAVVAGRLAGRRWKHELGAIAALAAVSLAVRTAAFDGVGTTAHLATLPFYLDWFCIGMALAVVSVAWHGRESESRVLSTIARRPWLPWAGAGLAFWAVSTQAGLPRGAALDYGGARFLAEHLLYALVATLFLLPAIFGDPASGWPRRLLAHRTLTWLGLISYGIFLYHGPLLLWLDDQDAASWLPGSAFVSLGVATLALAVAAGASSYYLVERPALRYKERRSGRGRHRVVHASPMEARSE